jgi:hypothetical protein
MTVFEKNEPLINLLIAATPGGIEASERHGQRRLVASSQLPIEGTEDAAPWEAMGVSLGENTDALFRNVSIPNGWSFQRSDHAMWSHLVDDQGRKRAAIFYKAAFYDQKAAAHIINRYEIGRDYDTDRGVLVTRVTEDGKSLFSSEPYSGEPYSDPWREEEARQRRACTDWLNRERPLWRDSVRQWESP